MAAEERSTTIQEVVIAHPGDPRLARQQWDDVGCERISAASVAIVVPLNATDARLRDFAEHFEIPYASLREARRAAPPVIPDVQQQFEYFPRRSRDEHDDWFRFFYQTRMLYRVQGDGMAPRMPNNQLVWAFPLDRPLTTDEEVIVHLRGPEWVPATCLLRQINAVTQTQIELVDCYRCDRIVVDRSEIASIEIASPAPDENGFNYIVDEPRPLPNGGFLIGCFVSADVPQWLRHRQIGKAFLGPDRSRDPWTEAIAA